MPLKAHASAIGIHRDSRWQFAIAVILLSATMAQAATPPSAVLVKDINPGTGSSAWSGGVDVNGTYFFVATDGTHGYELWKSNGTAAGTVMVSDINPGSSSSYPSLLTALGSYVIFAADDGMHGTELWSSDGTAAGTILLKDINPGSLPANPSNLCIFQPPGLGTSPAVYFMASTPSGCQLWKTEGTSSSTVPVSSSTFPGGSILAPAANGLFLSTSTQLFFSDGVSSNFTTIGNYTIAGIFPVGQGLYMSVSSSSSLGGYEPWYSDGTPAGTMMISDVWPGTNNSEPADGPLHWTSSGNHVYFTMSDGTLGMNLYTTDGFSVTKVVQLVPGPYMTYSYNLVDNNGALFFIGYDSTYGYQLWSTNGTTASRITALSPDLSNSYGFGMVAVGGKIYFTRTSDGSLWTSDGTTAGTVQIPSSSGLNPRLLTSSGTRFFFNGTDSTHGMELWSLAYSGPTVATAAAASPNPTSGTSTALSVLGADAGGEASLIYTWSATGSPPAGVLFANNGTNFAKNTTVSFAKAGSYQFSCQITNAVGLTATSSVTVTVSQSLTSIVLSATPTSLHQHQQFTATGLDQFNLTMTSQPTVTWAVSGGGTISSSGYFASNGGYGGPYTVTATSGTISGTAQLTTTPTSLIVVTGAIVGFNGQQVSETISISGSTGTQTVALTGATFSGGGASMAQATQTSVQYSILPNSGSTSIGMGVGTQPITPSISLSNCVINDVLRTGGGEPDSLPIGTGGAYVVGVTFTPALPSQVKVNFSVVTASGSSPGSAIITSSATLSGAGGTLTVKGIQRSGIGSSLRIVGRSPGSPAEFCSGPPFTVCPHPAYIQLDNRYATSGFPQSPLHGAPMPGAAGLWWGIRPGITTSSDTTPTGSPSELDECAVLELVQLIHKDANAWNIPNISIQTDEAAANSPNLSDFVCVTYGAIVQGQSGTTTLNQVIDFHCKICGLNHSPVPFSGFTHTHTTVAPENGPNSLTTSDQPANIGVGGQYPSPGKGSVPSDTVTPTPYSSPGADQEMLIPAAAPASANAAHVKP